MVIQIRDGQVIKFRKPESCFLINFQLLISKEILIFFLMFMLYIIIKTPLIPNQYTLYMFNTSCLIVLQPNEKNTN